jgi:two-component system sensor histidine kinase UhpB
VLAFAIALVATLLVSIIAGVVIIQQRRLLRTRASFAGRLLAAQDRERAAMARELHDDLVQRLDGVARLLRDAPDDGSIRHGEVVAEVSADLRGMAQRMHPGLVRMRGVTEAIESLLDELRSQYPLDFSLEVRGDTVAIPPDVALGAFRIVQEALRNAVRHAQAGAVRVLVERRSTTLIASVRDDGVGFRDLGERSTAGLGLHSMRERASLLRGNLQVRSTVGIGSEVAVTIPLREAL